MCAKRNYLRLGRFRIDSDLKLKKIFKIMKWLTLLFAYSLEAFLNDEDNYIEGWRRAKRVLVIAVKQMVLHPGITLGLLLTGVSTLTLYALLNFCMDC